MNPNFFEEKMRKNLWGNKKAVSLHRQKRNGWFCLKIGLWCNGNTTDSGPVFLGSNPSSPTKKGSSFELPFLMAEVYGLV